MSEKMKDSDETREEKFEERILKYTKPKRGKPMSEENNINLSSDDSNLYANTGNTGDVKSFQDVFKTYEIDFDKVNDLNDVIRILKAMKITFNAFNRGEYDDVLDLLKEAQAEK